MNIKLESLTVKYGERVILDNINHSFDSGRIHVVLGPNGSGKTTLIKNIVRLYADTREISYVAQEQNGNVGLTVKDYVFLGRYNPEKFALSQTEKDKRLVSDALEKMDLTGLEDRLFDTLSGGEKQRVMAARAIAQDASWIILDEPQSNMDVKYSNSIFNQLKLLKNEGKSIILICHDINYAVNIADSLVLMKDGKIIDNKKPEDITCEILQKVYDTGFKEAKTEDGIRVFLSF